HPLPVSEYAETAIRYTPLFISRQGIVQHSPELRLAVKDYAYSANCLPAVFRCEYRSSVDVRYVC
ncbi:MAG: hypothetical protein LRY51_12985, partial [Geovibrio sp.]|nr:hypothetical protein [Geovibrio sp.]